jgi:ABC-2 type transport system permease protein
MSVSAVLTVAGVEWAKLVAQLKVRLLLGVCIAGPFIFAAAIRVQSNAPADTLFGRTVAESGFAVPLVVLGFSALWPFAVLGSLVGGDVFAAEDRYGTWTTVFTRSRSRAEVFAGKVLLALSFSLVAVATLAVSSVAAGLLVIGRQPLIDLSGLLLMPQEAFVRVALAWLSILPPTLAFTALAVFVSVATRSSAAGIGIPVLAGLIMQLAAFVDGPENARRLVVANAFGGWHGLFTEPRYFGPIIYGTAVSLSYVVVAIGLAYGILQRRDIGR